MQGIDHHSGEPLLPDLAAGPPDVGRHTNDPKDES